MKIISIGFNFDDPFSSDDYDKKLESLKIVLEKLESKFLIERWDKNLYFVDDTISTNIAITSGNSKEDIENYAKNVWENEFLLNNFNDKDNDFLNSLLFRENFREQDKLSIEIKDESNFDSIQDLENTRITNIKNDEIVFIVNDNSLFDNSEKEYLKHEFTI